MLEPLSLNDLLGKAQVQFVVAVEVSKLLAEIEQRRAACNRRRSVLYALDFRMCAQELRLERIHAVLVPLCCLSLML